MHICRKYKINLIVFRFFTTVSAWFEHVGAFKLKKITKVNLNLQISSWMITWTPYRSGQQYHLLDSERKKRAKKMSDSVHGACRGDGKTAKCGNWKTPPPLVSSWSAGTSYLLGLNLPISRMRRGIWSLNLPRAEWVEGFEPTYEQDE